MAPGDLQEVLAVLKPAEGLVHEHLLVGLGRADDAAVYRVAPDLAIVETVDFFPPIVDDPYTWGAVAAANAMSDVYAMGGEVMFALAVAGFPRDLPKAIIAEVFRGGADKVAEAGGVVAGGHTVIDNEPKDGLCVTGRAHPDRLLIKGGLRAGDRPFLSKPVGPGVVTAAAKDEAADDRSRRAGAAGLAALRVGDLGRPALLGRPRARRSRRRGVRQARRELRRDRRRPRRAPDSHHPVTTGPPAAIGNRRWARARRIGPTDLRWRRIPIGWATSQLTTPIHST